MSHSKYIKCHTTLSESQGNELQKLEGVEIHWDIFRTFSSKFIRIIGMIGTIG